MVTIGIDPGKNGGIAAIINNEKLIVKRCPQNNDPKKMAKILKRMIGRNRKVDIIIENVWAFPGDSAMTAFKFGTNYGIWQGIFGAYNLKWRKVAPQTWQKDYNPLPKNKKERKNELKKIAKEFYDKPTLQTSDAILIAIWGKNHETN